MKNLKEINERFERREKILRKEECRGADWWGVIDPENFDTKWPHKFSGSFTNTRVWKHFKEPSGLSRDRRGRTRNGRRGVVGGL
jgi:hypothetical protein